MATQIVAVHAVSAAEEDAALARNPMYLAVLALLAGEALLFASAALLAYAAIMFVAFHLFVVLYEEPTLRRRFGEAYERYCRAVPRWLGRVTSR